MAGKPLKPSLVPLGRAFLVRPERCSGGALRAADFRAEDNP